MKYFIAVKPLPDHKKLYLSKWSIDEKERLVNPKIEYAEVHVELFSHREGSSDLSKWMKENNYEVKYVPESWFDWGCCGKSFLRSVKLVNLNENKNVSLRCVGRLKHNSFMSKGKLVSKTTFTLLKRKSSLSLEDMGCDPDNDDIELLELGSYEEGIYEIVTTNPSYDWETGDLRVGN